MGDFRFCSLLFQFLKARTSPVQSFSSRKRHVRTHPHTCPDSAHGIPKFTGLLAKNCGTKYSCRRLHPSPFRIMATVAVPTLTRLSIARILGIQQRRWTDLLAHACH